MSVLDEMRARNTVEQTFDSGFTYTIRFPMIRDCIIAGGIPLPVVQRVMAQASKAEDNGETVSLEDKAFMARYQNEVVKRAVVAINGEEVTLTDENLPDVPWDDYVLIVKIATREVEVPLADAPA